MTDTRHLMELLLDPEYDVDKNFIELHDRVLGIRDLVYNEESYMKYELVVKQYLLRLRCVSRWLYFGEATLFYDIRERLETEWATNGYIGADGMIWLAPIDTKR